MVVGILMALGESTGLVNSRGDGIDRLSSFLIRDTLSQGIAPGYQTFRNIKLVGASTGT